MPAQRRQRKAGPHIGKALTQWRIGDAKAGAKGIFPRWSSGFRHIELPPMQYNAASQCSIKHYLGAV